MISATEALNRLKEGNRRFVEGRSAEINRTHKIIGHQRPFAVVLGCSDSRVPPELVFDQGLGDLFIIRVAGNIVTPVELGSVEYAAQHIGTRLIVVLSHSNCGAVQATVDAVMSTETVELSPGLDAIVDQIRGSVNRDPLQDSVTRVSKAIESNMENSVGRLLALSPILQDLTANDGLMIVGAHYSIETGLVEF